MRSHVAFPSQPPSVPHRARRLIVGSWIAATVLGLLGTALSPYLLVEHPLVLIGLNPDIRHLILVANHVELWQAATVGVVRRAFSFVSAFGVASLYGYLIIAWMETQRPWLRRMLAGLQWLHDRVGVLLVLFVPAYTVAFFAGMARLSPRTFVLAMLPGQVAFVVGGLWFGRAIQRWTAPIVEFVSQHVFELTLAAVALVAAQQLWSRYRKGRQPRG